jgi:fermentation-respiration switch protein FrsA (DUF1100 family)
MIQDTLRYVLPMLTAPKFAWENTDPSLVDNGPLGTFSRSVHLFNVNEIVPVLSGSIAPVYSPISESTERGARGYSLWFSGAYTNHTALGETPKRLAESGWGTDVVPFREWDDVGELEAPRGRWLKARLMKDGWLDVAANLIPNFFFTKPDDMPLVLGGFSMGGAAAILSYLAMSSSLRDRIDGLVLVSPCFDIPRLEAMTNPVSRFVFEQIVFGGLMVALGKERVKDTPSLIDPALAPYVQRQTRRHIGADLASKWFIDRGRKALDGIRMGGGDPKPVLLIHGGESDETVSARSFERVKVAFPNTQEVVLDGAGHYVLASTRRNEANQTLQEFISRI